MLIRIFKYIWLLPLVALYVIWCVKAIKGLKVLIRMYKDGWKIWFLIMNDDEVSPFACWVFFHGFAVCVVSFLYWLGCIGGML